MLHLFFSLFFWPYCVARRILVPSSGVKPVPPAVEAWNPNHWTTREVPVLHFFLWHCFIGQNFRLTINNCGVMVCFLFSWLSWKGHGDRSSSVFTVSLVLAVDFMMNPGIAL